MLRCYKLVNTFKNEHFFRKAIVESQIWKCGLKEYETFICLFIRFPGIAEAVVTHLRIEGSGFVPWPATLHCVFGQLTLPWLLPTVPPHTQVYNWARVNSLPGRSRDTPSRFVLKPKSNRPLGSYANLILPYFHLVLFIMLYKAVLCFKSVDETLVSMWPFKWKLLSSTFMWYCLLCCTRWFSLLGLWMKP